MQLTERTRLRRRGVWARLFSALLLAIVACVSTARAMPAACATPNEAVAGAFVATSISHPGCCGGAARSADQTTPADYPVEGCPGLCIDCFPDPPAQPALAQQLSVLGPVDIGETTTSLPLRWIVPGKAVGLPVNVLAEPPPHRSRLPLHLLLTIIRR